MSKVDIERTAAFANALAFANDIWAFDQGRDQRTRNLAEVFLALVERDLTLKTYNGLADEIILNLPEEIEARHVFLSRLAQHISHAQQMNRWRCKHQTNIQKLPRGNTQWIDCKCLECGHLWVEG